MIHRVTWYAAGVLALVGLGTSVGYWGYNQKQQKDAYVRVAEVGYEGAFRNLVANFNAMRTEMADSLLTSDKSTFDAHLAGVSRYAFAAVTDLSKLPTSSQTTANLHHYLNTVDADARLWMKESASVADRNVRKQLTTVYSESGAVQSELTDLESQVATRSGAWMNASGNTKNQAMAVTGLKHIDGTIGKTTSVAQSTGATSMPVQTSGSSKTNITSQQAIAVVTKAAHVSSNAGWNVRTVQSNKVGSAYEVISGDATGTNQSRIFGEVSKNGKLLSFQNTRTIRSASEDFVRASKTAASWLDAQGYHQIQQIDASQYDHTATFTFAPLYQGTPVIGQPLQVHVALDNGQVTAFSGVEATLHPVTKVVPSQLSISQLRQKLSADFDVKMEKSVIVPTHSGTNVPAVAFYGTLREDTFSVYLSRVDGSEINVEKLT